MRLSGDRPISIAIAAMGGQGGGVLAQWIVDLAEAQGWIAQSTSVPGVAQRTGATLYYIELIAAKPDATPVLSLMPAPGDVDIVIAAEFMEAGRAMLRGLVSPDRTLLIASTHRSLAIAEKERPGDGVGDAAIVAAAAGFAAKRIIAFDMDDLAKQAGSVISASLFGALAGAKALPFPRVAFEAVIRGGGKGIEPSLRAFAAGCERAGEERPLETPALPQKRFQPLPISAGHPQLDALINRIRHEFPASTHAMLFAGASRLADYQDTDYAADYLDRAAGFCALDSEANDWALTVAAAKHIAAAMAYDDVISVADLKTRGRRFERVRYQTNGALEHIVLATEFMHPRAEEVVGLLPAGLGGWIEANPALFRFIDALVNKGRRVQTFKIGGFLTLYALASLRGLRRRTLRHAREQAHLRDWLELAKSQVAPNYDLAVEILKCRRLVKGYADTHARGTSKFARVTSAVPLLSARPDGAAWMKRLVASALKDEEGRELEGALRTLRDL